MRGKKNNWTCDVIVGENDLFIEAGPSPWTQTGNKSRHLVGKIKFGPWQLP